MAKTLSEVVVRVERDPMMKPSTTVYEHEVPILAALHGEDRIEIVERYDVVMPDNFTVEDEWERLRMKYQRRPKPGKGKPLDTAYRNGPKQLAEVIGVAMTGKVTKRYQTESVQKVNDPRRVDNKTVDTTAPVTLRTRPDGTVIADARNPVVEEASSPRVKDLGQPVNVGGDVGRVPKAPLEGQPGDGDPKTIVGKAERLAAKAETGKAPRAKPKASKTKAKVAKTTKSSAK